MPKKKARFDVQGDQLIVNSEVILEILDCTPMMLTHYKKEGHLVQPSYGVYDLIPSIRNYIRRLKNKAQIETEDGVLDFQEEKARLTKMQADKAEMEVLEMSGELARIEDVVEAWQSQLMDMKGKLLSMPSKLATLVVDVDSPAEAQDLMDDHVREALQELSEYENKGRHSPKPSESKDSPKTTTKADDKRMGRPPKKVGLAK